MEEDDEDEEPLPKRQKRKGGESASTSSPLKETSVEDKEEVSESSSGATHTSNPEEPLVMHPLRSAPPSRFARMPSISSGSEEDADTTRLVA